MSTADIAFLWFWLAPAAVNILLLALDIYRLWKAGPKERIHPYSGIVGDRYMYRGDLYIRDVFWHFIPAVIPVGSAIMTVLIGVLAFHRLGILDRRVFRDKDE